MALCVLHSLQDDSHLDVLCGGDVTSAALRRLRDPVCSHVPVNPNLTFE